MNVNDLLKAIDELNDADLEHFIEGALLVRARRRVLAIIVGRNCFAFGD